MYDVHEINQVIKEFLNLSALNLKLDIEDSLLGNKYHVHIKVNDSKYSYSHDLGSQMQKSLVKFWSKNDMYDSLHDYTGISLPWGSHTGVRPVSLAHKLLKIYSPEQIIEVLYRDYRISPHKAKLIKDIALHQKKLLSSNDKHIDIYISIPFCVSRCNYCSFSLIGIEKKQHLHEDYVRALCHEIVKVGSDVIEQGYIPRSIYIGGGTPTAISPDFLEVILEYVQSIFGDCSEITLEAGRADTIDEEMLCAIDKYPVTRININPQSMNQKTLDAIGRKHSTQDVVDAMSMARNHEYFNINMDVIAGLPGENLSDYKNTLDKVIGLGPESITVHTFALKRASSLNVQNYEIKGNSVVNAMLEYSYKRLEEEGFKPYYLYRQKNMEDSGENIGFCKPGNECIYNIDIMDESTHILALGSGGVSKRILSDGLVRRSDPKDIEVYIERIDNTIKEGIEFFS